MLLLLLKGGIWGTPTKTREDAGKRPQTTCKCEFLLQIGVALDGTGKANIPYRATLQLAGEHCTIGNVLTFPKRQGIEESKPKVAKAFLRRDSKRFPPVQQRPLAHQHVKLQVPSAQPQKWAADHSVGPLQTCFCGTTLRELQTKQNHPRAGWHHGTKKQQTTRGVAVLGCSAKLSG